ncbi:MAG: zonular occludens toxin domain-containing protein [Muribaculaceae bacterium]
MTISLYSGTPGSGKSLHATKLIRDSLNYKKPVIANYRLSDAVKNYSFFTYVNNEALTPEFLYSYAAGYWSDHRKFKEDHILLVIDEAQLLYNSREWQQNLRMEWLEFFSQHRKYGFEVIFIAQFDRMLDRQIRSLIEYELIHRRLGNFGLKGKIMSLMTGGELFVCIKRFYSLNEKIGVSFFKARKRIFQMYDSYAAFNRSSDGG